MTFEERVQAHKQRMIDLKDRRENEQVKAEAPRSKPKWWNTRYAPTLALAQPKPSNRELERRKEPDVYVHRVSVPILSARVGTFHRQSVKSLTMGDDWL